MDESTRILWAVGAYSDTLKAITRVLIERHKQLIELDESDADDDEKIRQIRKSDPREELIALGNLLEQHAAMFNESVSPLLRRLTAQLAVTLAEECIRAARDEKAQERKP